MGEEEALLSTLLVAMQIYVEITGSGGAAAARPFIKSAGQDKQRILCGYIVVAG